VLDEADQMLHMGFLPDVEDVISQIGRERSMMLFSATMPEQIRALARRYMHQPADVQIETKRVTLDEIEQIVVETTDRAKQDTLCEKLTEYNPYLGLIFCRTKIRADILVDALQRRGFNADVLHGDLSQQKREQVMRRFREAKIQFLVATDVAARGIDVEGVSHVFNYDIPHDVESYIHRIGRTGRAGQTGVAITFVTQKDREFLELIERGIKGALERVNALAAKDARGPRTVRAGGIGGRPGAAGADAEARPEREARPEGVSRRDFAKLNAAKRASAPAPVAPGRPGGAPGGAAGRPRGGPGGGAGGAGGRPRGGPGGSGGAGGRRNDRGGSGRGR
ncbi:MAG: helicase, partial [Firmicutes bacterium]|nr:helicase [Bacillota bacterium]